ncbi:MAG: hypothetical protein IPI67_13225 [Myxococcales bacterium]|nr:hypothetical protein [Myxococcales bacterium]
MRKRLSVVALATSLLVAPGARAQTRDPATADALFREARALMKQGDYVSACPKLADSQRLDPAAGTAINLGDCLEKLGKLADALQAHREALDMLQPGDKRIEPLKAQIATIERRAPKLTIKLAPGAPPGVTVTRDGVLLGMGALGTALPANVGPHEVIVTAPGYSERRYAATLAEGEAKTLEVSAGEAVATPAAETSPAPPPRALLAMAPARDDGPPRGATQRTLGWVLMGAGAVGLGVGVFELVQWQAADQRVKDECPVRPDGTYGCGDLVKARADQDAARRDARISNAAFGVGAVAVVGGVVLLLTAPEQKSGGLRVRASVATRAVGLSAEGTW